MPSVHTITITEEEGKGGTLPNGINGPSPGGSLARKRYQRGGLVLEHKKWILRLREDSVGSDGKIGRSERRVTIGTIIEYPTKRLARRAADQVVEPLNAPSYRPGRVATVTTFAAIYQRDGLTGHKRMSRKASRHHLENYIVPTLGDVRLDEINGGTVQRVVNAGVRSGLCRKTILNVLGTLRAMLKRAKTWNYQVTTFEYGDVALPQQKVVEPERSYTPEEAFLLMENAPSLKYKVMNALPAYLGLRCGEVLGVALDNILFDVRILQVRQSVVEGEIQTVKSKNSRRDLHIPDYLHELLKEYLASPEWKPNPWNLLFTNKRNKPYHGNRVREFVFNPLRDRLGLGKGAFHAFRHGNASAQLQVGANIGVIKDNLGHAKIETTLRYTHTVSGDQRAAVDKVAALFESLRKKQEPQNPQFCGVLRGNDTVSA
jgi:integrase